MKMGLTVRVFLLLVVVASVAFSAGIDDVHIQKEITDKDVNEIEKQWREPDDGDAGPREIVDDAPPTQPQSIFIVMDSEDRSENAQLISMITTSLQNGHVQIQSYQVEDDMFLWVVDDKNNLNEVVRFLVKYDEVVQIRVDERDLLPERRGAAKKARQKLKAKEAQAKRAAELKAKKEQEKKKASKEKKEKKSSSKKRRRRRRRRSSNKDEL
eukprot:m.9575 g.9575  ORF g.9575 m.9575 type:complete len:212 (-) comp6378_c0_seq1:91-726(-)